MQFILNTLHLANGGSTDSDSNDCKCVVHQTFYGKLSSTVTCDSCRNVTTAQDPYMDLSLDIRSHSKKRKHNAEKGDEVPLDLRDCLERFTAKEKLGSAEYTCRNCDSPQNATKQLSIKRLPPVLAVHLKVRVTFSTTSALLSTTALRAYKIHFVQDRDPRQLPHQVRHQPLHDLAPTDSEEVHQIIRGSAYKL
jgi:ubiquitin carboxyl-terminal hydrolase 22/27/51